MFNERMPRIQNIDHGRDGLRRNQREGQATKIEGVDERYWEEAKMHVEKLVATPVGRALVLEVAKILRGGILQGGVMEKSVVRMGQDLHGLPYNLTDDDWAKAHAAIEKQFVPHGRA
jgi:hypothetical protein